MKAIHNPTMYTTIIVVQLKFESTFLMQIYCSLHSSCTYHITYMCIFVFIEEIVIYLFSVWVHVSRSYKRAFYIFIVWMIINIL